MYAGRVGDKGRHVPPRIVSILGVLLLARVIQDTEDAQSRVLGGTSATLGATPPLLEFHPVKFPGYRMTNILPQIHDVEPSINGIGGVEIGTVAENADCLLNLLELFNGV